MKDDTYLLLRVHQMLQRFQDGIPCEEIGRNASLWLELMHSYVDLREREDLAMGRKVQ